jgi:translation initiation factor IF-1
MASDSKAVVEVDGVVKDCLPNTKFLVEIEVNEKKHEVIGYLSGKMRMHYIKILEGDKVKLELTPYDPNQGRIVYRYK